MKPEHMLVGVGVLMWLVLIISNVPVHTTEVGQVDQVASVGSDCEVVINQTHYDVISCDNVSINQTLYFRQRLVGEEYTFEEKTAWW